MPGSTLQTVLTGSVTTPDGSTVAGIEVTAALRLLRSETPLGTATTDAQGDFRLEYPHPPAPADIIVRARRDGKVVAEATAQDTDDEPVLLLQIPGTPRSEYQVLLDDVTSLLDGAGVDELTESGEQRDFSYLARGTGTDALHVAYLALAHRHATATDLPSEPFYGLLRQGFGPDLSSLAKQPLESLQGGLAAAIDADTIAPLDDIDQFVDQLRTQEITAAVQASSPSPLMAVFAVAVPDVDIRERIYRTFLTGGGEVRFWARLRRDDQTAPYADRLRLALRLGALTGNNAALVGELLRRFDKGDLSDPDQLAGLDDAWPALIATAGGVPEAAAKALDTTGHDGTADSAYQDAIRSSVEFAYPTATLAQRLPGESPAALFLAATPAFDVLTTPVNANTVPDPDARAELAVIQRVHRLAPRFAAVQALRENGFDSALAIARTDRAAFTERLGSVLDAAEAERVHARATQVHGLATNLVADFRTAGQFDVPWLPKLESATAQIPDWEELFGSADYCACPSCRNIYSEAAYLVDLLRYLERLWVEPSLTTAAVPYVGRVAAALYARREDLVDIELTCDNTNLAVPYVDLVNEILESAVVPEAPIPATDRQTTGDQTRLRLRPQHVNPKAYDKLRTAVYPFDLPFDLWREQVNTFLQQLGVTRSTLLTVLGPDATSPTLLVDERLGLPPVAARIVAGEPLAPVRRLAEYYGYPAATADATLLSELSVVRGLLDRTQMRYADLAALLETRFVNPGRAVTIVAVDPKIPYDTNNLRLQGTDLGLVDRVHRFVRLQRALGWSTAQLDRTILAANNAGRLDRVTLRSIAAVRKLASRLELPVDDVLCFYRTIDTYPYPSEEGLGEYNQLFLDPVVVPENVPNPFVLNADRTEIAVPRSLRDPVVTAALLGVLQVTDVELADLTVSRRAVTPNRILNLRNLSALVRTVRLARAVGLSVPELLRLMELYGLGGPFSLAPLARGESEPAAGAPVTPSTGGALPVFPAGAETEVSGGAAITAPSMVDDAVQPPTDALVASTEQFLDAVEAIRATGLSVPDVDAVLADVVAPDGGAVPDDRSMAATLSTLRLALQAVYRQTAQTTDEKGDLTRKELAQLGWDAGLVQQAVSTLLGTVTYAADLTTLASGIVFPAGFPILYSPETGRLTFTGPMSPEQLKVLQALSVDAAYRAALATLYRAPRTFVATRMKALRVQVYSAPLASLAAEFPMPKSLSGRVYYDTTEHTLCCRGYLSEEESDALLAASQDPAFQKAVRGLQTVQEAPVARDNMLFTAEEAERLFATGGPADRFHLVLTKIGPYLRQWLSETTVKQQLGQAAGLLPATADLLLGTWMRTPTSASAVQDFLTADFVGSDPAVALTAQSFPAPFATLGLLHRVALLLDRLRVTPAEVPFVYGSAAAAGWLDPNTLPTRPVVGASPLFGRFVRLLQLIRLRDGIPGAARTLMPVFASALNSNAATGQVVDELAARTGWNRADVQRVATDLGLVTALDFADERALRAVNDAMKVVRKLGVAAERVAAWRTGTLTPDAAQTAWQAAKSRYPSEDWATVAAPLQDRIRERQRGALVDFLIANPFRAADGAPEWTDANGLHDYFLLDVEMGPLQQTTRIAQAVYSVQLFVQRCLLNLEPQVPYLAAGPRAEWEWMKQYRLWEANQKVFLYPENYFSPSLRAGKSSFFTELEGELMQQEVTAEVAESTFRNYLEKLDTVARLTPCGTYTDTATNTLYVFARTQTDPRAYYWRKRVNESVWTTWERIDLDIDSDTLLPTVWQGRLYLFWATFSEEASAASVTLPTASKPIEPVKSYYKIQLSWSQHFNGRWQPKKIAKQAAYTLPLYPFAGPLKRSSFDAAAAREYVFRLRHQGNGDLHIYFTYNKKINGVFVYPGPPLKDIPFTGTAVGRFAVSQQSESVEVRRLILYPDSPSAELYENATVMMPPPNTFTNNNEFVENPSWIGTSYPLLLPRADTPAETPTFLTALGATPGAQPYRLLYPHQYQTDWQSYYMFFTDGTRSYLIKPHVTYWSWPSAAAVEPAVRSMLATGPVDHHQEVFDSELEQLSATSSTLGAATINALIIGSHDVIIAYHPSVTTLVTDLNQGGVNKVLSRWSQIYRENDDFQGRYAPNPKAEEDLSQACVVTTPFPKEDVDFTLGTAYADYNWELFFHIPLLLAEKLAANQRFAEAQRWFHFIFDPTNSDGFDSPQRFWQTKPFFETTGENYYKQRIELILDSLGKADPAATAAVNAWLANPFQPDVVARLRTTAYQKAVVMKYLDNLIAWGDQLFRQDTLETINAASQLYILAAELLGRRPDEVTENTLVPQSYRKLQLTPDSLENAVVQAEHLVTADDRSLAPTIAPGLTPKALTYFRIPRNDKLVGYWDTVADRLFKIRNSQNIDGVQRAAALFGPPIDPNLLVRATAAGLDINTILDDITAPLPHHRFAVMINKAKELANEVKSFGAALLAALEKRDAEALARLSATHELSVLKATRNIRVRQVSEQRQALEAVNRQRTSVEEKHNYYAGRKRTNEREDAFERLTTEALDQQEVSRTFNMIASVVSALPDIKVGSPTTTGWTWGSSNVIAGLRGIAEALATGAAMKHSRAQLSSTLGSWDQRFEDWQFQAKQAQLELNQIQSQIAAAEFRLDAAELELGQQDRLIANATEQDEFLRGKFTNKELYDWMTGQLATVYFQGYQLAYDVAKRAERSFRHELGVEDSDFIRFGYWDGLHKGLLAGERLTADINRMDAAYLEADSREFELSKRISLAQIDPKALVALKENGRCYVSLPEALFDLDTPGHYMRRIKTLSISVPCVAGPYTPVNLTATLLRSSVRVDPRVTDPDSYPRKKPDTRFRDFAGPIQSIVTSTGQDDSGLFEARLNDERFLPFEGTGVISEWQLSLPDEFRQFDYESITDVVLHVRYTARDGGDALAGPATQKLRKGLTDWVRAGGGKGLCRTFSARREFGDQWSRFLSSTGTSGTVQFTIAKDRFAQLFRGERFSVVKPELVLVLSHELVPDGSRRYVDLYPDDALGVQARTGTGLSATGSLVTDPNLAGLPRATLSGLTAPVGGKDDEWTVTVSLDGVTGDLRTEGGGLNPAAFLDLLLVCPFTLREPASE
ncbi:hypothetical protein E1263_00460 [Kribbella antibiotica]|uniref:Cyclic nucleotide-binding domain-containing protein n=1 Tax=Kribbella antibiotica TaxID=190195 RepID=A0A4R4ZW39_9ACTN|nr:neuraminidase-like domain-containing protein [Kribbella antibiotica]TDD63458.1 hypothetical protein E1263_00460 [Kribbella antibiotica]